MRIRVNPRWLKVCDIKRPRTGLEAKFSYAMTAAMIVYGVDTAADRAYDDALCADPRLTAFLPRVEVAGEEALPDTAAAVRVELREGRRSRRRTTLRRASRRRRSSAACAPRPLRFSARPRRRLCGAGPRRSARCRRGSWRGC